MACRGRNLIINLANNPRVIDLLSNSVLIIEDVR